MPCLIDIIKENTEKRIKEMKSDINVAQTAVDDMSKQAEADNANAVFELAEVVSDIHEAVFELAALISELTSDEEVE